MKGMALKTSCCTAALLITLAFCGARVFAMTVNTGQAPRVISAADKSVAEDKDGLKRTGNLPVVTGFTNAKFQDELNALIVKEYNDKVEAALKDSAKSVNFSYEPKPGVEYYSLVMRTSTAAVTTKEEVRTFVVSQANKLMTINDVLGPNGEKIVNKTIADEISKKPGTYNTDFSGIAEGQSFYVEDGSVVVIFDKYAIGPGALGTPTFQVNIASVRNNTFTITKDDSYIKEPYSVKMIPLRVVCSALGFKVEWENRTRSVYVTRENFLATMTLDKNAYFKNQYPAFTLEFAPELKDGVTYLPISFFERILDACYTVDQTGSIAFSYYAAP